MVEEVMQTSTNETTPLVEVHVNVSDEKIEQVKQTIVVFVPPLSHELLYTFVIFCFVHFHIESGWDFFLANFFFNTLGCSHNNRYPNKCNAYLVFSCF
jgi:hypothetical protein